ncbi:MAG: hypothetical protein KC466_01690, partial [Myxococcales bacterium]|nr:hypothetical protein [Myxococcales bacterium]
RYDRYIGDLEALDELRAEISPEIQIKKDAVQREHGAKRRALWGLPVITAVATAALYFGLRFPPLGLLGAALDLLVIVSGVVALWRMRAIPALRAERDQLIERLRRREYEFSQRHERVLAMSRERGPERLGPYVRQFRAWREQTSHIDRLRAVVDQAAETLERARAASAEEIEKLRAWLQGFELPFDGGGGEAELARVEEEFGTRRAWADNRAVDLERLEAQLEEAKRRMIGVAGRLTDTRVNREQTWRELAGTLRSLDISLDDPERLDQALALFRDSYGAAQALRAERRSAEAAAQAEAEALERHRRDLEGAEGALAALLATAGVDSAEEFHSALAEAAELREISQQRAVLEGKREAALGGGSVEDLDRRLGEVRARLGALGEAERSALAASDDEAVRAAEERGRRLAGEREDLHVEHERLAAQLDHFFEGERHPSAVEEELEEAAAQLASLVSRRRSLEIARDTLREVAERSHEHMAASLHEQVEEILPILTGGRYGRVQVSPELDVLVWSDEKGAGAWLTPDELSHGTRDQIYFALRFGIAGMLAGRGEPIPFLLDDPFVNYDRARLEAAVDLLGKLGARNQIFLFTCS